MSNKIQTIVFEDNIIEIFYNSNLHKNPYLIRFTNYYNTHDIRVDKKDLEELSEILNKIIDNDSRNGVDNADNP